MTAADPRLQTKMDTINARSWTLPIITEVIAGRRFDELVSAFEETGISFPPIAKPGDMFKHPHVMRPGGLATFAHARWPNVPGAGAAVRGGRHDDDGWRRSPRGRAAHR